MAGRDHRRAAFRALRRERTADRRAGGGRALHLAELMPGGGASAGLPAVHGAGQARDAGAAGHGGLPGAPVERAVGGVELRGAVGLRAAAGAGAARAAARRAGAGAVAGVLVAVDHRRGLHAEHAVRVHAAVAGAVRGAVVGDGAAVWAEPFQPLAADAAGGAGLRRAAVAAAAGDLAADPEALLLRPA